jgi:hypothetical protein
MNLGLSKPPGIPSFAHKLIQEGEGLTQTSGTRPRLAFFRTSDPDLPSFLRIHLEEHVRCLSLFFDVSVISGDCDYGQVCDLLQPDLALFESGSYSQRHEIRNTDTNLNVPKLGFLDADAYCASRTVFLADMARWGVETFFTPSAAMAEYTPEIADRLFVWPNFADDRVFRDYGLPKTIPVLFTGSQAAHYPWRNRVSRVASAAYPTMICPHHGRPGHQVQGEALGRLLNSAQVVPACGTIARDVLRTHVEIAAARSCLMTERADSLLAAGFTDMESCVFADEDDAVEKLGYLFSKPDELARITDAGHKLVQTRHTASQRDELLQWLTLHQELAAGEKIVQRGPFARLEAVPDHRLAVNAHVISGGVDRDLLRRGEIEQRAGDYETAQRLYRRCLNYHATMPEPILKLAECALAAGRPADALGWITASLSQSLEIRLSPEPDPVEWAYHVRALLCKGSLREAARRAAQFPSLCHDELARIRSAVWLLRSGGSPESLAAPGPPRSSLHVRAQQSTEDWLSELCVTLNACGQHGFAELLRARERLFLSAVSKLSPSSPAGSSRDSGPWGPVTLSTVREQWATWMQERTTPWRHRHFGPDDFGRLSQQLAQHEPGHHAYIVGSSARRGFHKALMKGFAANPSDPAVHCLPGPRRGSRHGLPRPFRNRTAPAAAAVPPPGGDASPASRDLLFVLGEEGFSAVDADLLGKARLLVLDGISGQSGQRLHEQISGSTDLVLVSCDVDDGDGYAVYRRVLF